MLKFFSYNIILPKYFEIVKKKPAEKIAAGGEGAAEEGGEGILPCPSPEVKPRHPVR